MADRPRTSPIACLPTVSFVTLGCPKNEADTARMRALLEASAFAVSDDIEQADIVIVNTCGFISAATEESIERILDLVGEWLELKPDRHLVVAGCLTSRYGEQLAAELGEVSLFVGVEDEERIVALLGEMIGAQVPHRQVADVAQRVADGPSAFVKIADGCDRCCSYCTIPSIRGPFRSRPLGEIVAEVAGLVATGAREIVLVAQDTSCYGRDLAKPLTLSDLIDALCAIDELAWLRVMYVQPDGLSDELLDCFARNDKVCRYFEIPMQHVSERILRLMGRPGSLEAHRALVARIRARFADATIRTTLIAGYPSETEEEFLAMLQFVEQTAFDYVGVFAYSPEEGTPAAEHPSQISESVRTRRANELSRIAEESSLTRVEDRVGHTFEVLIEERDEEGRWQGRHHGQAPDIDGIVLVDAEPEDAIESGMIVAMRIDDTILFDLEGSPAS